MIQTLGIRISRSGRIRGLVLAAALSACGVGSACSDSKTEEADGGMDGGTDAGRVWSCLIPKGTTPDFVNQVGCEDDFTTLASRPLDSSIPGARSAKTVIDRLDGNRLYVQNSNKYPIHWDFASANLSGDGKPIVPALADFNTTEYYSPSRRFLLGALTHYEGPDKWCYEIAPYDTSSADMIAGAYALLAENAFIGSKLYFHPTSETVQTVVPKLPKSVKVITTDELFEGIDYQALNLAESYGQLRFITAEELATQFVTFRDIVVLDHVPNDISVVMGIITSEFQTPLSHVNVLSMNRGTPNMALRDAYNNKTLRNLEGKWVHFVVGPFDYTLEEVSQAEADAWWDQNKPSQTQVPGLDTTVTDLRDIADTVDLDGGTLLEAIKTGIRAFGGKATHFGAMAHIDGLPLPKAFAIPVYYYVQFMETNGFYNRVDEMLADTSFQNDPTVREQQLVQLQNDMMVAPIDADFDQMLLDKINTEYPGILMRFRSSTNAEDLDEFTGAGNYTSCSGQPDNPDESVEDALRKVWSSIWNFRAFEERSYRSIDHKAVGMAILVHFTFVDEAANGVALTNNPFDTSGLEPAFYINTQVGEASVVQPEAGVMTDQLLYYFDLPGQPVTYINHSNITVNGADVLTLSQIHDLGMALDKIRTFFRPAYGPPADDPQAWYAMDVEFKFWAEPGETPILYIKQARPNRKE